MEIVKNYFVFTRRCARKSYREEVDVRFNPPKKTDDKPEAISNFDDETSNPTDENFEVILNTTEVRASRRLNMLG